MANLKEIGMLLVLIDGILAIISGVLHLLGEGNGLGIGTGYGTTLLGTFVGAILIIIVGIIFIGIYQGKVSVGDEQVTAVFVLVMAIIFTTILGIIAGIILLVDLYY